jgi:enolase
MSARTSIMAVVAREVLDSRGTPTLEVEIQLEGGLAAWASAPAGTSLAKGEPGERRDGDSRRYRGHGMRQAVETVTRVVAPALRGLDAQDQARIDGVLRSLDGAAGPAGVGGNVLISTSLAVARAAAFVRGRPLYRHLGDDGACTLPVPLLNLVDGGTHAPGAVAFEEFMIAPYGAGRLAEALRMAVETRWALRDLLAEARCPTVVGEEGAFTPSLRTPEAVCHFLVRAIERAGYVPGEEIGLAVDVAAGALQHRGHYVFDGWGGPRRSTAQTIRYYEWLARLFPIVLIEDGLDEDDRAGWRDLTQKLGATVHLAGDDLFATSPARLRDGIRDGLANAVVVKPNQAGTLSDTLETIRAARAAGYAVIVSHRSGETEDTFIADLAVAVGSEWIKAGAPCRTDRTAKYNRLLRIEDRLGPRARFHGRAVRHPRAEARREGGEAGDATASGAGGSGTGIGASCTKPTSR